MMCRREGSGNTSLQTDKTVVTVDDEPVHEGVSMMSDETIGQGEPDLQALDEYLMSDESPENCMQFSDLDGFLIGTMCPLSVGTTPTSPPSLSKLDHVGRRGLPGGDTLDVVAPQIERMALFGVEGERV